MVKKSENDIFQIAMEGEGACRRDVKNFDARKLNLLFFIAALKINKIQILLEKTVKSFILQSLRHPNSSLQSTGKVNPANHSMTSIIHGFIAIHFSIKRK